MAARVARSLLDLAHTIDENSRLHSVCPEGLTDGGGTVVSIAVSVEHVDAVLTRFRTKWPLVSVGSSKCSLTGVSLVTTFVPCRQELSKLAMQDDFHMRRVISTMLRITAAASVMAFFTVIISKLAQSS